MSPQDDLRCPTLFRREMRKLLTLCALADVSGFTAALLE